MPKTGWGLRVGQERAAGFKAKYDFLPIIKYSKYTKKRKWHTPMVTRLNQQAGIQGGAAQGFKEAVSFSVRSGTNTGGRSDAYSVSIPGSGSFNGCRKVDGVLLPLQTMANIAWQDGPDEGINIIVFSETGCS